MVKILITTKAESPRSYIAGVDQQLSHATHIAWNATTGLSPAVCVNAALSSQGLLYSRYLSTATEH